MLCLLAMGALLAGSLGLTPSPQPTRRPMVESLDGIEFVTQLTSLGLCRSHGPAAPGPLRTAGPLVPGPPPAMPQEPPPLPGAVPLQDGELLGPGTEFPRLPPALARLPLLLVLRLENLPPNYDVLRALGSLRRLEMRVSGSLLALLVAPEPSQWRLVLHE
jgi:hypothetical protein